VRGDDDLAPALGEVAEDVPLGAAVEREDAEAALVLGVECVARVASERGGGGPLAQGVLPGLPGGAAHEGDEVLACGVAARPGEPDEVGVGDGGVVCEDARHDARDAEASGEGAGVDVGQPEHAAAGEVGRKVAVGPVVGVQVGQLADDEPSDLDPG
jgi:hypothetical protein